MGAACTVSIRPSQMGQNGKTSQGAGSCLSESEFMVQERRYTDWALVDTKSTGVLRRSDVQAKV